MEAEDIQFVRNLLTDIAVRYDTIAMSMLVNRLRPEYLAEPEICSHFFSLCEFTHHEDLPVAILVDQDDGDERDISELIRVLSDEHYRPKLFTDRTDQWGDNGLFEVWPLGLMDQLEHEVLIVSKAEYLARCTNVKRVFTVVITDELLASPRSILKQTFPTWNREELAAWHDRQFSRRKNDFFLNDDVPRVKWLMSELHKRQPKALAEIGVWGGDFTVRLPEIASLENVYCVDLCRLSLANAKKRLQNEKFSYHYGFCEDIPLPDNYVDTVVAAEVLEHVFDIKQSLKEIKRICQDNAVVLITTPNFIETNPGHLRIFDPNIYLAGEDFSTTFYDTPDPHCNGWCTIWRIRK